jgi:hypothetical protein
LRDNLRVPLEPMDKSRLILAYGRHWRRGEVCWSHGQRWQLLGRVGVKRPGLRMCDFGYARGVYVLERRGRPVYVGIARGAKGFAGRLTSHHLEDVKDWTHFSWFSFDGVKDGGAKADPRQWASLADRDKLQAGDVKARIEEIEALMVGLLGRGLTNIQKPKFGAAREWTQVVQSNYGPGGICHRVAREGFLKSELDRFRD